MKIRAKEPSWIKKIFFGIVGFGIILGFCWRVARFIGGMAYVVPAVAASVFFCSAVFMPSKGKEHSWIKKIFFGIVGFGIILGFCWSIARFIGGMAYVVPAVAASVFFCSAVFMPSKGDDVSTRIDDDGGVDAGVDG